MAYNHERKAQIDNMTTGNLVLFIAMQAVINQDADGIFDSENDAIWDNETIWATQELDRRFVGLQQNKEEE